MNRHNTVIELSAVAIVLSPNTYRIFAAFRRARLVDATDRLGMGVVFGHDLLASISQLFFIPLDQFEKAL